jgi:hypothetical protein
MNSYIEMQNLHSRMKKIQKKNNLTTEEKCYVSLVIQEIRLLQQKLNNIYNMEEHCNFSDFADTWIGYYNNKIVQDSIDNINKIIDVDETIFTSNDYLFTDSKSIIKGFFNYSDSVDTDYYDQCCW